MLERLEAQERRSKPSDDELWVRAQRLSARYLDGRALPRSVRWVSNQRSRWGSCTVQDASIRLSDRLQGMPEWVVDYVLAARARAPARAFTRSGVLGASRRLPRRRTGAWLPRRVVAGPAARRRPALAATSVARIATASATSCRTASSVCSGSASGANHRTSSDSLLTAGSAPSVQRPETARRGDGAPWHRRERHAGPGARGPEPTRVRASIPDSSLASRRAASATEVSTSSM